MSTARSRRFARRASTDARLSRSGGREGRQPWRTTLSVVVVLLVIATVVWMNRREVVVTTREAVAAGAVPVHYRDAKASTWFCPGVPGNDAAISGTLIIANSNDVPVGGTITRYLVDAPPIRQRFAVAARSNLEVDALAGASSPFVAALVESQGAALVVEQRTSHRAGDAVALCASSPAASWYLADGFTGADSIEHVVITNPSLDSAILDVVFVTTAGERSPQSLKGMVIPPESVRVLEMASLDARNEVVLAVNVSATVGRVVVGRSQHYLGRGRLGYTMSLGASAVSDRWYFADAEKGENVRDEFVIFNPFRDDQQLTFIVSPNDGSAIEPLVVTAPGRRVTTFAPSSLGSLGAGEFSVVVSASMSDGTTAPGVVVERVATRQQDKSTATSIVLGASSPWTSWVAVSGAISGVAGSLRVFNPGALPATFRIAYLGPAGEVPIVGYEEVVLAPGASTSVALGVETDDRLVSIGSDEPIVVQRRISRGTRQSLTGAAPLVMVTTRGVG